MAVDFSGFVLRKPRMASPNAPSTSEGDSVVRTLDRNTYIAAFPDNAGAANTDYLIQIANNADIFVPDQITENAVFVQEWVYQFNMDARDIASVVSVTPNPASTDIVSGLITYASDPGTIPEVTWEPKSLRLQWSKNDSRKRFDFNTKTNRWEPLPGTSPEYIGSLDKFMTLPVYEGVEPVLVLGSKDLNIGTLVPVSVRVGDAAFQDYVNEVLAPPAGEAVLNDDTGDLIFANDLTLNFLAQDVFFYRENFFPFEESAGLIGPTGTPLFLNPIPTSIETPLIRVDFGRHLRGEFSNVLTTPSTGFDFVWSDSGHLYLDPSLEGNVYYDGVVCGTDVAPVAPSLLGTIETASIFMTAGLSSVNLNTYEIPYLFTSTGVVVERVERVNTLASSHKLPVTRAQVDDTGKVQLSYAFRSLYEGQSLYVGTADFPIEQGISFRLTPSPDDPTNVRGVLDGKALNRIVDEQITDSLSPGATFRLPQIPLDDVDGYGPDQFFKVVTGLRSRVLTPDVDVIYDFENRQIQWAEQNTYNDLIRKQVTEIALPHQVIHPKGYTFELDEGNGFTTLVEGQDLLIDFPSGKITPIEVSGPVVVRDVGTLISPSTLEAATQTLNITLPSLLKIGNDVYTVVSSTPTTITVDGQIDIQGTTTEFEVLENPDVVYKHGFSRVSLTRPVVDLFRVSEVSTYAPSGPSLEFVLGGVIIPHVFVETEILGTLGQSLSIPVHYTTPEANFDLRRESQILTFTINPVPAPDEYTLVGADIVFNAQDEIDFSGTNIIFIPSLSDPRATGPIEVLKSTREIGLPSDKVGSLVRAQIPYEDYQVSPSGGDVFLNDPLSSGSHLFARYEVGGQVTEEEVSFSFLESVGRTGTTTTFAYGSSHNVDTSKAVRTLVNGVPFNAPSTPTTVTVSGQRPNRLVQVQYFVQEAIGGEKTFRLTNPPDENRVTWQEGTTQTFKGVHDLDVGDLLLAGDQSFWVTSVTSSMDQTTIEVDPPCIEGMVNPTTFLCKTLQSFAPVPWNFDVIPKGVRKVNVFGAVTPTTGSILTLDGDPFPITAVTASEGITTLTLASKTTKDYATPVAEISDSVVYAPNTGVLFYTGTNLVSEPATLIRFHNGKGAVVDPNAYRIDSGVLVLDPALVDTPDPSDTWFFAFTRLKTLGPVNLNGYVYFPRFRATYTRRINNPWVGATLRASFDFRAPDTFYFRVVSLEDYASEVASELETGSSSTFGPQVSLTSSPKIYERGVTGAIYRDGDLRDKDRAARFQLQYFNDLISNFESILEVVDGRVIGDRDGKFLFRIQDNDQPGGEDPVTGELIPYYANPSNPGIKPTSPQIQALTLDTLQGAIQNHMDDLVLVSPKPFRLDSQLPVTFEYLGTFRSAWEPSKISRLYPESRNIFTITAPDRDNDTTYEFLEDFNNTLADLKQSNILSVSNVRKRGARAYVREGGIVANTVEVAIEYNEATGTFENVNFSPQDPNPVTYSPAFEVGDYVNMGRVTYTKTGDIIERVETVYAYNMEVTSVGADSITVTQAPPSPGLTTTNPSTITPVIGDTIWVVPKPTEPPFYDSPDFFLNASEGELLNATLPDVFSALIGQNTIDPLTYLDAVINFKNPLLAPFRFPALDGGTVDDDGDRRPPYSSPQQDSEILRIPFETAQNNAVELNTWAGIVQEMTVLDPVTLQTSTNLTLIVAPERYDLLIVEGVTASGDSVPFNVGSVSPTQVTIATFIIDDAIVSASFDTLYSGTGERDAIVTQWNDGSTDFTAFAGVDSATLHIGASTYTITGYFNGYLEVSAPIAEAGPLPYFISADVTGDIPVTLDRFEAVGVDFSGASGTATITGSGPNNGTYVVQGGGSDFAFMGGIPVTGVVNVGISNFPTVASGTGSVDTSGFTLWTADPVTDVTIGMTLIVSNTNNAGRYTVVGVRESGVNEIDVDRNFFGVSGDSSLAVYPMDWKVGMPRRFSPEIQALQEAAIQIRPIYADNADAAPDIAPLLTGVVGNASVPLKEKIFEIRDFVFDSVYSGTVDADAGTSAFTGVDFDAQGVESGDFVVVESGINQGFYRVTTVTTTFIEVVESNTFTTYTLSNETGVPIQVYRPIDLTERSHDLILYEVINVLSIVDRLDACVRMTTHDPDDLIGQGLWLRRGDPSNTTLLAHRTLIEERRIWITDAPSLRDEIEGLLAGTEALYDIRYAWINYRVNMVDGSLVRRKG